MLEFVSIEIKNLGAIEHQIFKFDNKLNVIVGFNLDKGPEEIRDYSFEQLRNLGAGLIPSNGSSKSLILEAISLALFNQILRPKITIRDLIRIGTEECEITLICKNTYLELDEIKIIRTYYYNKNKTSKIQVFETKKGEEKELPYSISGEFEKYILDYYIGINKENIFNFFLCQKDKYTDFLMLPDARKKELLSDLIGINKYNYVNENFDEEIEKREDNLDELDRKKSNFEGKIETYNENIKELGDEESFKKDIQKQINSLNQKIENNKEEIKKIDKENKFSENKIPYLEKLINHWNKRKEKYEKLTSEENKYTKRATKLEKKLKDKDKEIKEVEEAIEEGKKDLSNDKKSVDKLEIVLNKLRAVLDSYITCPKCGHKFDLKQETTEEQLNENITSTVNSIKKKNKAISELDKEIEEAKEILQGLEKEKKDIKKEIRENDKALEKIEDIGSFIEGCIKDYSNEKKNIEKKIELSNQRKEIYSKNNKSFEQEIKEIKELTFDSIIKKKKEIEQKIKNVQKDIKEVEKEQEEIQKQIQNYKDAKIAYINFKNYLFTKYVYNIEVMVNSYLSLYSPDFYIRIDTQKTLVSKETRDEITIIVVRGGETQNYFACSTGERAAISIAFIVTFQQLINNSTPNGLSLLALDEIATGIDSYSQDKILKFLQQLNKTIFYVSHVAILSDFKTTYIIKKNNTAQFINN